MMRLLNRHRAPRHASPPSRAGSRPLAWLLLAGGLSLLTLAAAPPAWRDALPLDIRGAGPDTALCLVLAGLALLGHSGTAPRAARTLPGTAAALFLIPLLVLLHGLIFHRPPAPSALWGGHMSQAVSAGWMALGAAAWLGRRITRPATAVAAQLALLLAFFLGQLGVVGHLSGLMIPSGIWLAPVYLDLPAALGLMLAAAGLFQAYRGRGWFQDFYGRRADRTVFVGSTVLMGTVLITGAVLSIGMLAKPGLRAYQQAMGTTLEDTARSFELEVREITWRADRIAGLLFADSRDDGDRFGAYMNTHDAEDIALVRLLAADGGPSPAADPSVWGIALAGEPHTRLLWQGEWLLESIQALPELGQRLQLRLSSQTLGTLAQRTRALGMAADVLICGRQAGRVYCFPDARHAQPYAPDAELARPDRPMGLALAGRSGTTQAPDGQGRPAILAYAPIGRSGLGVVWGVDAESYYAPMREAVWLAILAIAALSLLAAYLMHRYVRPIVRNMARTEAYLQTVLASAPDGVLTVDAAGRVVSCNPAADSLFVTDGASCAGQPVRRFIPDWDAALADPDGVGDGRQPGRGREIGARTHDGAAVAVELALRAFPFEAEHLHVAVVRDISERKAMEDRLARVLHQTSQILQSAGEGILGLDNNGRIVSANPAALRILHYQQQDLIGRDLQVLLQGGQPREAMIRAPRACPIHDTLEKGHIHRVDDAVFWNGEGLPVWVEYVSTPMREHEALAGAVVVFADITQRRLVEQELRDSEIRYRLLAEHATDMISRHGADGTYLYVSPACESLLGMAPPQLLGRNLHGLVHPEDAEAFRQAYQELVAAQIGHTLEFRMLRGDGRYLWVESTSRRIVNPDTGQHEVIAVTRDVSRRKQVEITLKRAQAVARLGSWSLDLVHDIPEWSDETYRIFGLAPGAPVSYELFLSHLHPDDRDRVDQAWQAALKGTGYDIEHRILAGDREKWVHARAELELGAGGKPMRIVGTVLDITELKEKQEEIFASRQKLRELMAHRDRVREEERAHIAREIHDELGQYLTALRMDAALLEITFGQDNPRLAERAEAMKKLIDQTIKVVRSVASNLRPGALDLGLASAAEWLVAQFRERTGVPCLLHMPEEDLELDDARATGAFRILQESLTNIARYAQARRVDIRIQREGHDLVLEVRDDGVGFDPAQVREKKTYGLMGIRERAIMFGGSARFDSRPGHGTSLLVHIPLENGQPP